MKHETTGVMGAARQLSSILCQVCWQTARCVRCRGRRSKCAKILVVGMMMTVTVLLLLSDRSVIQQHIDMGRDLLYGTNSSNIEVSPKKSNTRRNGHITSFGEQLAARVNQKCSTGSQLYYITYTKNTKRTVKIPITTSRKHRILFCPMCKLASTYWTRFFTFLKQTPPSNYTSPYDVPLSKAPPTAERLTLVDNIVASQYTDYYKFVFVRDPYSRILSAYVDKFFAPNPVFWQGVKKLVPKHGDRSRWNCGAHMTFKQYVQAIIRFHNRGNNDRVDCHDQTFLSACRPCQLNYSYIGKMETFSADAMVIYNKFGLNDAVKYLTSKGKGLADDDALKDTVFSPYQWRRDIEKCITWREALHRVWRKLQIRGVVGKEAFPLSEDEVRTISPEAFMKVIKEVQSRTPYTDRKLQRQEALQEIYASLSDEEVEQLARVYEMDFDLFEYDASPQWLKHRNNSTTRFGYLSV